MKYYGDYLGFRFGEHHSRDLGLYRVSDGDRYNDPSIPAFTDTTAKITGGDGTYYWDSFYTQRTFTINCAFDDLSENQLREIRQIFNGKAEDWLVFDETPYKKYRVKVQSPPQIKYLTFREDFEANGVSLRPRVHKGEITFQFISYTPYAIDNFKTVAFKRTASSSASSTAVYSGVLTAPLTLRSAFHGGARKLDVGDTIYIPVTAVPTQDGTKSYYDCKVFAVATDTTANIEYRIGASPSTVVSITKNGSNYSVQYRSSTTSFISSLNTSSTNINYYTHTDNWNEIEVEPQVYNKNPYHYYMNSGSVYVSCAGQSFRNNKYYNYVPEFYNSQNLDNAYPNTSEWYDSTRLLSAFSGVSLRENVSLSSGAAYFIYNPGDLPTDVKIIINSAAVPSNLSVCLYKRTQVNGGRSSSNQTDGDSELGRLEFSNLTINSDDKQIVIDTAKNLVYGTNYTGTKSGRLYNKYISSGDFFKLPVTQTPDIAKSSNLLDYCDYIWVNFLPTVADGANVYLDYNYLYY